LPKTTIFAKKKEKPPPSPPKEEGTHISSERMNHRQPFIDNRPAEIAEIKKNIKNRFYNGNVNYSLPIFEGGREKGLF
jgi:hypothetical protein